jgi:hypothetical protein
MLDARIVLLAVIVMALALTLTCNTALAQQVVADVPDASASNDALLRRWLPLALNGQSEAQYKVGMMNLYGIGGPAKDVERGVDWLRVNAEVNLTHFHRSRRSKSDPPGSFCLRCSGA